MPKRLCTTKVRGLSCGICVTNSNFSLVLYWDMANKNDTLEFLFSSKRRTWQLAGDVGYTVTEKCAPALYALYNAQQAGPSLATSRPLSGVVSTIHPCRVNEPVTAQPVAGRIIDQWCCCSKPAIKFSLYKHFQELCALRIG